jgi:hypothetical protein
MTVANDGIFPYIQIEVSPDFRRVEAKTFIPYTKDGFPARNRRGQRGFYHGCSNFDYDAVMSILKNTRLPISWAQNSWDEGFDIEHLLATFTELEHEFDEHGKMVVLKGKSIYSNMSAGHLRRYNNKFVGYFQGPNFPSLSAGIPARLANITTIWR